MANVGSTLLEQAAQAEKRALDIDGKIARFFTVSRSFVTRQREHNPFWYEQMEVRWRTETFPPLAARRAKVAEEKAEQAKAEMGPVQTISNQTVSNQEAIDGIEKILHEMFPPEPYVPQTGLERLVGHFWKFFCRPELWIVIAAALVLYLGMCGIGDSAPHVPAQPDYRAHAEKGGR